MQKLSELIIKISIGTIVLLDIKVEFVEKIADTFPVKVNLISRTLCQSVHRQMLHINSQRSRSLLNESPAPPAIPVG